MQFVLIFRGLIEAVQYMRVLFSKVSDSALYQKFELEMCIF